MFQSHLDRIRVRNPEVIDPWLLLALLNTEIVALQVRAKRFTRDIIETIGRRVFELAIPVRAPKRKRSPSPTIAAASSRRGFGCVTKRASGRNGPSWPPAAAPRDP